MTDIFQLQIDDITELILDDLIQNKINEAIRLDYKRDISSNLDLTIDVSAFANTRGGLLIYGIETDNDDIPSQKCPLNSTPKLKERIENILVTSISPRINGLLIRQIPYSQDSAKCFIVIKIPFSPNAPHIVTKNKKYRYYKRFNFQSIPMEEYEIERLYQSRLQYRGTLESRLEIRKSRISKKTYEGFQRMICITLPSIYLPNCFELENKKELQDHLHLGSSCIWHNVNHSYRSDAYVNENELSIMGISQDGSIFLNSPLIKREDEKEAFVFWKVIYYLYHFFQVVFSAYKSIGYFSGIHILFSLEGLEGSSLVPSKLYELYEDYPNHEPTIKLFMHNEIEALLRDSKIQTLITELASRVAGGFGLPPQFAESVVKYMAKISWYYP